MDHERSTVVVQHVNNFDDAVADAATDHLPLLSIDLPWESAAATSDHRLDFYNGASMLGRMLPIPVVPSEIGRHRQLTI